MITIIEDFYKEDSLAMDIKAKLVSIINEKEDIVYSKDKTQIKGCMGCFGCWIKNPGECVINDMGNKINESMMKSDQFIIFTKLTYGGYSTFTKKVLDRSIPNILPFFKTVNNEIHHKPRYEKYPELIVIAYGQDIRPKEEETFHKLVKANALNLQNDKYKSIIIKSKEDLIKIDNIVG